MYANLNTIKERLEKEGIVNKVKYYEGQNELAVNEDYFIYDQETGESDLYFIKIIVDKNGRYVMETCFCEKDFMDRYNNQEDYIKSVVDSMNLELDIYNNKILTTQEVFNSKALGEHIVKSILDEQVKDADTALFWIAEEISSGGNNIYRFYEEDTLINIFEEFFHTNTVDALEYVKYLTGINASYDKKVDTILLDIIITHTKKVAKTCYWNEYLGKFMPRDMMEKALYELSSNSNFSQVTVKKDYGEYIEVVLKNNLTIRVLSEEHDYSDCWYSVYVMEDKSHHTTVKNISSLDELLDLLNELSNI